jgi:hypothetical protein
MLNKMQYFISGLSNSGPVNKVAEALANRIIRAVKEQQPFKVPLPPPLIPTSRPKLKLKLKPKLKPNRKSKRCSCAGRWWWCCPCCLTPDR